MIRKIQDTTTTTLKIALSKKLEGLSLTRLNNIKSMNAIANRIISFFCAIFAVVKTI